MHRSSSTSRVSDSEDSLVTSSSSSSLFSSFRPTTDPDQLLPTYDPLSHVAQREHSRLRSAEKAVHAIPLLLIVCAIILWFFSTPAFGIISEDMPSYGVQNRMTNSSSDAQKRMK